MTIGRPGGGAPHPRAWPGATPAGAPALLVAAGGALVLLAAETGGEHVLGLTAQQSRMTGLFGLYTLVAVFVEEVIFRGHLVVEDRGRAALLTGIIGASLGFALLYQRPEINRPLKVGRILRMSRGSERLVETTRPTQSPDITGRWYYIRFCGNGARAPSSCTAGPRPGSHCGDSCQFSIEFRLYTKIAKFAKTWDGH